MNKTLGSSTYVESVGASNVSTPKDEKEIEGRRVVFLEVPLAEIIDEKPADYGHDSPPNRAPEALLTILPGFFSCPNKSN